MCDKEQSMKGEIKYCNLTAKLKTLSEWHEMIFFGSESLTS
jgi:hypothetical protein